MKKIKRQKNKKNIRHTQQQSPPTGREKILLRWLGLLSPTSRFWASVVLCLTIFGSWYAFSPKLFVTYSSPLNQTDLRSTPFVVRNNSLLSIKNICIACYSKKTITEHNLTFLGITFKNSDIPPIPSLDPGEGSTFFLPFMFKNEPIIYADIEILVSYYAKFLPFKKEKSFRFNGQITDNGIRWFEKSLSEK